MHVQQLKTYGFHSDEPEQVSEFIEKIYAGNAFRAQHAVRRDVNMVGMEWRGIGIYDVDYEMPFHFHSEEGRPNYLFLSCERGGAKYLASGASLSCQVGDVIPISSLGDSTCITAPEGFGHLSVILDAHDLNDFVARWVGRPLPGPIQFELQPVSPAVATQWNCAADCLRRAMALSPMPDIAVRMLYEHMLRLIVCGHRHNFSDLIHADDLVVSEEHARSAVFMIESDPTRWKTLGTVAHALGCSIGGLDRAIGRLTGRASKQLFLDARMRGVHRALLHEANLTFVAILRAYGFDASNRFVVAYRRRFGEPPSATYRKNPGAPNPGAFLPDSEVELIAQANLDHFIDQRLGDPITLKDLAEHLGLSEQATIGVFKARFAKTPMQYVIERRLEHARHRLCNTGNSILSIAIECGFGSQSYLTTQIKRHYGVTPRRLRTSVKRG